MSISLISKSLESYAKQNPDILLLGYFGSWAAGKPHSNSDVDLAIAGTNKFDINRKLKIIDDLSSLLKFEIDLVDLNDTDGVIMSEILQDAVWVKKDVNTLGKILSKHLISEADFKIYRDRILQEKQKRFLKK